MRWKTKIVPKTTNNINKGIINFLNSKGHIAVRINVEGQYDEIQQVWRRSGSTQGVLDVQCTLKPKGITLVVDSKKGRDSASKEQRQYAKDVQRCGGYAYFAKDLEDFKEYYYSSIEPFL